jgi:hypothetical protein
MHSLLYLEIIINVCTFLINNVSGDIATDCIGGSFSGNFHNCDGKDITEKQQTSVTIKVDMSFVHVKLYLFYRTFYKIYEGISRIMDLPLNLLPSHLEKVRKYAFKILWQ